VRSHICTFSKSENVQCAKKGESWNRTLKQSRNFSLQKGQMCKNVQKSAKKVQFLKCAHFSHICSFQKSEYAIAYFFRTFKRAKKCAITHSHNFKERQNVRSHICTFLKSSKMCDRTFAHFQRAKMCDMRMCHCPTLSTNLKDPYLHHSITRTLSYWLYLETFVDNISFVLSWCYGIWIPFMY